jgi:hypothetical protein
MVLALVTGACSDSQDPGITPGTTGGPSTTSQALAPCPPGGPDATTPAAGCLGEDGAVVRPDGT